MLTSSSAISVHNGSLAVRISLIYKDTRSTLAANVSKIFDLL